MRGHRPNVVIFAVVFSVVFKTDSISLDIRGDFVEIGSNASQDKVRVLLWVRSEVGELQDTGVTSN